MHARTKLLSIFGLGLALLAATGASALAGDDKPQAKGAKVGDKAPAWTAKDIKGKEWKSTDLAGKIVVLEWFNSGCPVCRTAWENGVMGKTIADLKAADPAIVYLAVNSSADKPKDEVIAGSKSLLDSQKATIPLLVDYDGTIGRAYGARTTPHMFVIDTQGVLRYNGAICDDKSLKKTEYTNYVVNAVKQIKAGETVSPDTTQPFGCSVKYARSQAGGEGGEKDKDKNKGGAAEGG